MAAADDDARYPFTEQGRSVDRPVAPELAGTERWQELVAALLEQAESAHEPAQRSAALVRAATVCETELQDLDKAYLVFEMAFHEDAGNDAVVAGLARVAGAAGRWPDLIAGCEAVLPQLATDQARARLLGALAGIHELHLADGDAAERALTAALAYDGEQHRPVLRQLVELCLRRGDPGRAVEHLLRGAEASRDPALEARLRLEAAHLLHTRMGTTREAAQQYRFVLALTPDNALATEALADLAWEDGDMVTARSLYEALLPAFERRGAAERARVHERLAAAASLGGDEAGARSHYRRAHQAAPSARVLVAWGELAARANDHDDLSVVAEALLAGPEAGLSGDERVTWLERLARSRLAQGDPSAAQEALATALELAPEHRACREAMVEACEQAGDVSAATHHHGALLALLDSDDERFDQLMALGRRQRDELGQVDAALETLSRALELRPHDHAGLHETLDLLTAAGQWKRAVQVLELLTGLETGTARARYLVATGNILNYEVHATDEAIARYEQALDEDPSDLKTFERIDKILTSKRAWRDEARSYRRMIKRLPAAPEHQATLLALWRGLGEIYRTRLKDYAAAAASYEVCAQLDPRDGALEEILAELYELEGSAGYPRAVERRGQLLARAVGPDELAPQLRALLRLYIDHRQADRVFCVSAALVALGDADAGERELYDRYASRPLPRPRAGLSEELWFRCVYHPLEDRRLSQLFAAVSPTVALARAREPRAWGLDERRKVPLDSDRSFLGRILVHASALLGVGLPALYVHPEVPGEIDLATVIDRGQLVPTFVVGGHLVHARDEREIAFVVGKRMALLRLEHLPLWPNVVSSVAQLRAVLFAALKLFAPALEEPAGSEGAVKQYLSLLQRSLPPHALEPLGAVVPALLAASAAVDVAGWSAAAELTANRAGMLVCGDLLVAARALAVEAQARGGRPEAATLDLVRWSASPEYLVLREQLGLAHDPEPVPRPAPAPGLVRR